MAESSNRSRLLWMCLRIALGAAALSYLFFKTDLRSLGTSIASMPVSAVLLASFIAFAGIGLGSLRWWILLEVCGATSRPSRLRLFQLTLVGLFYSTVIPGAVAGDVVRGLATATSFEGKGATSSLAVALLERLCGLFALVVLAGGAFLWNPLPGVEGIRLWGAVGSAVAAIGICAVAFGGKLAPHLPPKLGALAQRLPDVQKPFGFATALGLSLFTQLALVCVGHTLVTALEPSVRFQDSLVVMPAVSVASYFPISIAGGGPREAAMVAAYSLVGVAQPKALAAALSLFACMLFVAATGGVISVLRPLRS